MNISPEVRLAMQILLDLAKDNQAVTKSQLIKDTKSQENQIDFLLNQLLHADLIQQTKSNPPSYSLLIHPKQLRLRQVVEAIEGPINELYCTFHHGVCGIVMSCNLETCFDQILQNQEGDTHLKLNQAV